MKRYKGLAVRSYNIKKLLPHMQMLLTPVSLRSVNVRLIHNHCGFNLVSILVGTAIGGVVLTTVMSMIGLQQRETKAIQQQLAKISLKTQVLQTLSKEKNCTCQFKNKNIGNDRNKDGHLDGFNHFKRGCRPTSEIIARSGKPIGASVRINSVRVSEIKRGPTTQGFVDPSDSSRNVQERIEYFGILTVTYQTSHLVRSLSPTEIPLYFVTNSSGVIQKCGANQQHAAKLRQEVRRLRNRMNARTQEINNLKNQTQAHDNTTPSHTHSFIHTH